MANLANRAKRRASPKPPAGFGEVLTRLPEPELAGDLTVAEVNEVRGRDTELVTLERKVQEAGAELQHLQRVHRIAQNERAQFIRGLCDSRSLAQTDAFSVDLDRGVLMRVATRMPAIPPEELVAVPGADGADGADGAEGEKH